MKQSHCESLKKGFESHTHNIHSLHVIITWNVEQTPTESESPKSLFRKLLAIPEELTNSKNGKNPAPASKELLITVYQFGQ